MRYRNNPLNIRYSSKNNFKGQSASDNGFCTFNDLVYGLRAVFVILRTYDNKGVNTIMSIINRWAPPEENATSSYITFICDKMNVNRSTHISLYRPTELYAFISAMASYESGTYIHSAVFDKAYEIFFKDKLIDLFNEYND